MNLVRFNHPGFANLFENLERTQNELQNRNDNNTVLVNIIEEESSFVLEVAAPGLKKDDFNISLDNQILTISSEVKEKDDEKEKNYSRKEFNYGNFSRSFTLPKNIKHDAITAEYNQGVLSITLPVKEESKLTREIKIS